MNGRQMDRIYPVDLQSHSIYSDGTDTPEELIAKAAAAGIRVLAVTDHDSVMGVAEAQAAGMKADVQILPAIEFSTAGEPERDFLDINILGYAIDPTDPALLEMLDRVIKSRVEQKIRQVECLHTYGLHVPVEEVLVLAGGVPGRPHIAQIALKHNPHKFSSLTDVFQQYLAPDAENPTYVRRRFSLRVEDAIELTHAAGGKAVLAHPGIYKRVRNLEDACAGWLTSASMVSKCTIPMVPRSEAAQQTGSSPALPNSRRVLVCSPPAAATITASANAIGSVRLASNGNSGNGCETRTGGSGASASPSWRPP